MPPVHVAHVVKLVCQACQYRSANVVGMILVAAPISEEPG